MTAFYNDNDPFAASWLQELIAHGHLPQGTVDQRSIVELDPADVAGSGQRHFFAGIGGWPHALRLAGIPDDADIWTGSCPCQGLSDAGQRRGFLDPRHLWPAWFALIEQCRPSVLFGEQVASTLGLRWLDLVFADLERCGYTVGAADLCAASVGAPHARQRLFFVAYTDSEQGRLRIRSWRPRRTPTEAGRSGVADSDSQGLEVQRQQQARRQRKAPERSSEAGNLGDPRRPGGRRNARGVPSSEASRTGGWDDHRRVVDQPVPAGSTRGFWADADWILCRDPAGGPPVARPVEPGTFPLASGVPGRVGSLRGYGNSIVPQVAAEFVLAFLDAVSPTT